ncbi:hypothetical protein, partial [Bordetella pertussis]|uniref:hypothetical protein n=1 Tax=Bordetella pertussis TaxID=520 RepID=UPI000AEAFDC5
AGLALARQAYPAVSSRYLLAMHGKAALRAAGLPQATLLSALLMSDRHVHVFDAGSAPPWQALAGQDAGWLAR